MTHILKHRVTSLLTSIAITSLSAYSTRVSAEPAPLLEGIIFPAAQSWLESWNGEPLISANWSGRFRPYVFKNGSLRPVLPPEVEKTISSIQLMAPLALSPNELIMVGHPIEQGENFDLYYFSKSKGTLTNLTNSAHQDDGSPCIDPASRRISWGSGNTQYIATINKQGIIKDPTEIGTRFLHCLWASKDTLLGTTDPASGAESLDGCHIGKDHKATCMPVDGAQKFDTLGQIYKDEERIYLSARADGSRFRELFEISFTMKGRPAISKKISNVEFGDTHEQVPGHVRTSFGGRYTVSGIHGSQGPETIYRLANINGSIFSIYSDSHTPRTLALADGDRWRPIHYSSVALPSDPPPVQEIEIPVSSTSYPAFYFGPQNTLKVVLWWHGGPKESVSPRYNPYFHLLQRLGFGTLAVNYPGSTSCGASYETLFTPEELRKVVDASFLYLKQRGVNEVISWSVSMGQELHTALLTSSNKPSALIEYSPISDIDERREVSFRQGIPYFRIQGIFDPFIKDSIHTTRSRPNVAYHGGHDIETDEDFALMSRTVTQFLGGLPPTRFADENTPAPAALEKVLGTEHLCSK